MTVELADYLLGLDKYVLVNDAPAWNYDLIIKYPLKFRLALSAPDDLDQVLLVDIKESDKKSFKISVHHQDNSTQSGLLRVDFYSRHLNPSEVLATVPAKFTPFAGQWLDEYDGHIHYVVDGYKPLAWAIPLEFDDFPVRELTSREDYPKLFNAFFQKINLKTEIRYHHQLRAL